MRIANSKNGQSGELRMFLVIFAKFYILEKQLCFKKITYLNSPKASKAQMAAN
jgi:hypothetical protein